MKKDKMPAHLKQRTVADLQIGEFGYTTYWQLNFNKEGVFLHTQRFNAI